jgi:hypothetical protein
VRNVFALDEILQTEVIKVNPLICTKLHAIAQRLHCHRAATAIAAAC